MKKLVVYNIFIVLLYLCILVNLTTAAGLGASSCRYLGKIVEDSSRCPEDVVMIEELPDECSSFVYDGIIFVPPDIKFTDAEYGSERLRTLINFDKIKNYVYLFFSHGGVTEWHHVLLKGEFSDVALNMRSFLDNNPVKGLILSEILYPFIETDGDFYEIFNSYVKVIKDIDSNLEIGLYMSAKTFTENESNGTKAYTTTPWFDFTKLNKIVDFYVIEFESFNDCNRDSLHDGITPMISSKPEIMTLNTFAAALGNATIPKDQLYFEFLISPKPIPEDLNFYVECQISYNGYCDNALKQSNTWCVDDSDTLYGKGKFTKEYANGFIGRYIDLVDRGNKCGCGEYMAFDFMVNGFNGEKVPKICKALVPPEYLN